MSSTPGRNNFTLLRVALWCVLLAAVSYTNTDPDLWGNVRFGLDILRDGSIPHTDAYSFTSDRVWVNHEWLAEVFIGHAFRIGGTLGLILLKVAAVGSILLLLGLTLRRERIYSPIVRDAAVAVTIFLTFDQTRYVRPQLLSLVAFTIVLTCLTCARRGRQYWLLLLPPVFAIWANLHGGFVYGWILIATYLVGSGAELLWGEKSGWTPRVRRYGAMLSAAVAGTLVNPHGLGLHRHLIEFFGTPYLMENTAEFVSPNFHESGAKLFLLILVGSVLVLALHRPRPALPRLFLICASIGFALISVRNIPLFGLTALPVLALHLDTAWRRLPDPRGVRARFEATARRTSTLPWVLLTTVLLVILAVNRGRVGSRQLIRDQFDPTVFPVAAVDAARRHGLEGPLFGEFAWGGYLVYAWPEQKIFIDGGTDFFGEKIFREYVKIKQMAPGWRDLLDRYRISLMLLERERAFTHQMARDGRWQIWYCDSLAVVLRQRQAVLTPSPSTADSAERVLDHCAERPVSPAPLRQSATVPREAMRGAGSPPRRRAAEPGSR